MTFREKFDYLKDTYASEADFSEVKTDIAAQFTMTDSDCGGTFYIAHIGGKTDIEPYDYHDNTVAVSVNSRLLEDILKGEADAVKAFLDGELDVEGNAEHAMALISALKPSPKEEKTVCRTRRTSLKQSIDSANT